VEKTIFTFGKRSFVSYYSFRLDVQMLKKHGNPFFEVDQGLAGWPMISVQVCIEYD
jgi:hypothetical protein